MLQSNTTNADLKSYSNGIYLLKKRKKGKRKKQAISLSSHDSFLRFVLFGFFFFNTLAHHSCGESYFQQTQSSRYIHVNWERFDIQQFQLRLFEYRSRHRMYNYGLAKCILKRCEEVWIIFFNTLMAQWTNSRTLSDKITDKRWCNIISNHAMTQSMQYRMFIKLNEWNRTYSMRTKFISKFSSSESESSCSYFTKANGKPFQWPSSTTKIRIWSIFHGCCFFLSDSFFVRSVCY